MTRSLGPGRSVFHLLGDTPPLSRLLTVIIPEAGTPGAPASVPRWQQLGEREAFAPFLDRRWLAWYRRRRPAAAASILQP